MKPILFTFAALILAQPPLSAFQKGSPRQNLKAAPVVRIIQGSPLTVHVGDDMSFQVFNSAVPGSGQIFPTQSTQTADMGVLARIDGVLFAPNFNEHPGSAAGIGNFSPWTPVSIGQVSGNGSAGNPFSLLVRGTAGNTGVQLDMTVTYVNGEGFCRIVLLYSSSATRSVNTYFAGDIFLADSDSGIPLMFNSGVGGQDCFEEGYSIIFFPISPAVDAFAAAGYASIWQQIASGGLNNQVTTDCTDNGAGLEWRNRTVSPSSQVRLELATSFGVNITTIAQVNIAASDAMASETGNDTGTFTVSRSSTSGNLVVRYDLLGTATNGVDYTMLSGSLTIPQGQSSAAITVSPLPDGLTESAETVVCRLRTDPAYTIGGNSQATVTISDGMALCQAPNDLRFTDVEADTFTTLVTYGAFGGICRLILNGEVIGAQQSLPGAQVITTGSLEILPGTTYQVCCTNLCADGSESLPTCATVTTLGGEIPPLPPPKFIKPTNFFATPNGELACLFPDPNSDGSDISGQQNLIYVVTLQDPEACNTFIGPVEIVSQTWPLLVKIPGNQIPTTSYIISVKRRRVDPLLKRDEDSSPQVAVGPDLTVLPPPTVRLEFDRWLLHMPRKAGGFSGIVEISNPNPTDSALVLLVPFRADGTSLLASEEFTVGSGQTLTLDLYGTGPNAVFSDPTLLDQVSHVAIWDQGNVTKVSLRYIADRTDYGVWVSEVNLRSAENVTGTELEVQPSTPNNQYFAAVAILNLSSNLTPEVFAVRRNAAGTAMGEISLGTLNPGQKTLSVLSSAFPSFLAGANYTIEARSPSGTPTIQVLGLTGNALSDFLNTARVVTKR